MLACWFYFLSLHDALPIYCLDFRLMGLAPLGSGFADDAEADEWRIREPPAALRELRVGLVPSGRLPGPGGRGHVVRRIVPRPDRKSTRLNSSHQIISYAVF